MTQALYAHMNNERKKNSAKLLNFSLEIPKMCASVPQGTIASKLTRVLLCIFEF
jgi:hypothetical protein